MPSDGKFLVLSVLVYKTDRMAVHTFYVIKCDCTSRNATTNFRVRRRWNRTLEWSVCENVSREFLRIQHERKQHNQLQLLADSFIHSFFHFSFRPGVKVSRNAPERHSGPGNLSLEPGASGWKIILISQPEATFLGPAS